MQTTITPLGGLAISCLMFDNIFGLDCPTDNYHQRGIIHKKLRIQITQEEHRKARRTFSLPIILMLFLNKKTSISFWVFCEIHSSSNFQSFQKMIRPGAKLHFLFPNKKCISYRFAKMVLCFFFCYVLFFHMILLIAPSICLIAASGSLLFDSEVATCYKLLIKTVEDNSATPQNQNNLGSKRLYYVLTLAMDR